MSSATATTDTTNSSSSAGVAVAAAAAADLRERGNYEFSQGDYDKAVALYSAALEQAIASSDNKTDNDESSTKEQVLNYCNRSACYFQMELYEESCQDAQTAWNVSKETSIKAAYRYGKSVLKVIQQKPQSQAQHANTSDESSSSSNNNNNNNSNDKVQLSKVMLQKAMDIAIKEDEKQQKALQDLWNSILQASLKDGTTTAPETSIKHVKRPISIREFTKGKILGHGNFSDICVVTHKETNETFALKSIEKKKAADLYKRQHPNVYNEISMERRVLLERLTTPHPSIIRMYHAFQDYNTLYYLMELHTAWGDLWSELRYDFPFVSEHHAGATTNFMVGCHRSQIQQWMYELIDAIEFLHQRGIVHRDLKPENILLTASGHVLVIDFGTAKDLIKTDLNGPEFVGTPDFMSPEAVTGDSGPPGTDHLESEFIDPSMKKDGGGKTKSEKEENKKGAGPEADLWALGAILFILQTGQTPFWCSSPYLAFLKIKRANACLGRPKGIVEDSAWDLIQQLMKLDPNQRLGAGTYVVKWKKVEQTNPAGYSVIRNHPYFDSFRQQVKQQQEAGRLPETEDDVTSNDCHKTIPLKMLPSPLPSLQDLCYRAVATQAYLDSLDVELLEKYPPGQGNKQHDMTLLNEQQRNAVLHVLDRCQLLRTEPRLFGRFYEDPIAARLDHVIRPESRDVLGLTQMNDEQGKAPHQNMHDPYAKPIPMDPIQIVHLVNPLFAVTDEEEASNINDETKKQWKKLLKRCIATINRKRPKLVVVTGHVLLQDSSVRKALARISETIPVVIHDGSAYFTFWKMGVQCIALQTSSLRVSSTQKNETTNNMKTTTATDDNDNVPQPTVTAEDEVEQVAWLRSFFEQCRMSKHPLFVFCDSDPRKLPQRLLKKLARGRTLCILGLAGATSKDNNGTGSTFETKIEYAANEVVDDASIRSTDSEEDEKDEFTMQVRGSSENGLYWITVHPKPDNWSVKFEPIQME